MINECFWISVKCCNLCKTQYEDLKKNTIKIINAQHILKECGHKVQTRSNTILKQEERVKGYKTDRQMGGRNQ